MAVWKSVDKEDGSICAALFNLSDEEAHLSAELSEIEDGLKDAAFTDMWDGSMGTTENGRLESLVPAHGVKAVRLR